MERSRTMSKEEQEKEPLSPMARVFQTPDMDCCIITMIGFKMKINVQVILQDLTHNVSKHPRFCNILGDDSTKWIKTEINIEDHVVVPNVDLEKIGEDGDGFIDDYISHLTTIPLDRSKPLWDIHILNIKTSEAEAVMVIRSHHSLGDGMSMMSLLVASTRKSSNMEESPTLHATKRRGTTSLDSKNSHLFPKFMFVVWNGLRLIYNTVVDLLMFLATLLFLKDTVTPLQCGSSTNTGSNPRRFYRRTFSKGDIILIKKAMNLTINDVLIGVTQAALSRYLNGQYGNANTEDGTSNSDLKNLPAGIRFRAEVAVNIRSEIGIQRLADMMAKGSKCRWGNYVSCAVLPFYIRLETDPLVYLSKAKFAMDRLKNSLFAPIAYWIMKLIVNITGSKVGAFLVRRAASATTLTVSNIVGPNEELSYRGHPIAYISLSAYGPPQALFIHYLSYAEKMVITMSYDPTAIPDPHKLCDEMEVSLEAIKANLGLKPRF